MKEVSESIPAEPFFLETDSGARFCIYYPHNPNTKCFGTFIYIHPMGKK